MLKKLIVILLVLNCSILYGQTIKTDVLVIGGSASGIAAAIQCARSKVKTIWAGESLKLGGGTLAGKMLIIDANNHIPAGIWGEFRQRIQEYYKKTPGYDTTQNAALRFDPNDAVSILKKITDTIKNLTTYANSSFETIKKDGDRWEVNIKRDGKIITVKARVVIDATETGEVSIKAGAKFPDTFDNRKNNTEQNLYRTSIATGEALPGQQYDETGSPKSNYPPFPAYFIPMKAVLLRDADNILITEKALPGDKNIQYLPFQLTIGQGVGTIAAFCAFFKTNTQHLNVRVIQGELLDFKGYLLPFTDIVQKDPAWRAVQQICATGLLRGIQQVNGNNTRFVFMPDSVVTTAGIKPVLNEIYTRFFLWFAREKPGENFTIGNALSFISDYTLTDPDILKAKMQKDWKALYKFKLDFDINRPITRREFAVLANEFLNPFARTVDLSGRLIN